MPVVSPIDSKPMGIACAPQIWMNYITLILSELEDKKYIAIMDDLLIHSTRVDHWKLLEQLLKSMCKNGLRLSPKKCQLFKTNLIYMGNELTINKRTMTITPWRSRTKAINNKIPTPRTPKQCKSFFGVVNYLSLFCPDLQKLLKPIVELARKGRPFIWGEAQEKAFREVRLRLKNPPVLHLPKVEGRYILYSDASIEVTGSSLWQTCPGR